MFVSQFFVLTNGPVTLLLTFRNNHMMQGENIDLRIIAQVACGMREQVFQCQSYDYFTVLEHTNIIHCFLV